MCAYIYIYVCVNHHELSIPYDDIVALGRRRKGSEADADPDAPGLFRRWYRSYMIATKVEAFVLFDVSGFF